MKDRQKSYTRRSKEQIRRLLAQYNKSGQSKSRFARQNGLQYHTLLRWLKDPGFTAALEQPAGFTEIRPDPATDQAFAEVQTQTGSRIRIFRPVPAEYLLALSGR